MKYYDMSWNVKCFNSKHRKVLVNSMCYKTAVINDLLPQAHSLASSEHCFHLNIVLFWKVGTDWKQLSLPAVTGSALWIDYSTFFDVNVELRSGGARCPSGEVQVSEEAAWRVHEVELTEAYVFDQAVGAAIVMRFRDDAGIVLEYHVVPIRQWNVVKTEIWASEDFFHLHCEKRL